MLKFNERVISLKGFNPGSPLSKLLADRRDISWEEACDLLKAMGDDFVIATITNEQGYIVLRCQPMGMFGPAITGINK